jgi:thiol-disulfide isomerase/thioredoxin
MKPLRYSWLFVSVLLPLASLGADAPAESGVHTKGSTPIHVSHGQEVKLEDYFVPGKTVIFDFYSEFCPPCRAIGPMLEKLHSARSDIDVVKVDINRPDENSGIDWKSPVAKEFKLESIPHFVIVGPDGKKESEGDEAYDKVVSWIQALP